MLAMKNFIRGSLSGPSLSFFDRYAQGFSAASVTPLE
jgi:hypothetical protein